MKRLLLPIIFLASALNADLKDFKLLQFFKQTTEAPQATSSVEDSFTQAQKFGASAWDTACAASREVWLATKDFGSFAVDTSFILGELVYEHPKVASVIGAIALVAYIQSSSTVEIEAQYLELQRFIDNTLAKATQFDTSIENINAKKAAILSACGIYIPVTYAPFIGPWLYQNEIRAIDNFFEQIVILRRYMDTRRDVILIQSQTKETLDAARLVQLILSKRLNFYAAQRILAPK